MLWVTRAPKTRLQCWAWCEHNLWHVRSYYTRFLAYIDEWNSTGEMCERRASLSCLVVYLSFPISLSINCLAVGLSVDGQLKWKSLFIFTRVTFCCCCTLSRHFFVIAVDGGFSTLSLLLAMIGDSSLSSEHVKLSFSRRRLNRTMM